MGTEHPPEHSQGCRESRILICCWRECKVVQLRWETAWQFLKRLDVESFYDPAIPPPRSVPKKNKTHFHPKLAHGCQSTIIPNKAKNQETTRISPSADE